jgi:hypothetical protein
MFTRFVPVAAIRKRLCNSGISSHVVEIYFPGNDTHPFFQQAFAPSQRYLTTQHGRYYETNVFARNDRQSGHIFSREIRYQLFPLHRQVRLPKQKCKDQLSSALFKIAAKRAAPAREAVMSVPTRSRIRTRYSRVP